MKAYECSAVASALVIVLGLVWYIGLVMTKRVQTVTASWIVSTTALSLSLVTYFSSPHTSRLGGLLNTASACAVGMTTVAVFIRSRLDGIRLEFSEFQRKCLRASAGITILWIIVVYVMHGTGVIPNLLTQLMLVISYSMLIAKFWKATENTESLFTWWCVLLSSVIGMFTAYMKSDPLALIYALRSTVMCGILVYALHRIGRRNRLSPVALKIDA